MKLNEIRPARGATKKPKRVGRGPGSGHGKTSTRGHKGHQQRSGYRRKLGFEGGQMPLVRRIPKRGFTNVLKVVYEIVKVEALGTFAPDTEVTPELLKQKGMIKGKNRVKILGNGELSVPLTVKAHKFSKSAREKIIQAKGKIEQII
ncbi:50S ribosomal protein L15 [candidate division WOR-3 bacterium]|nr:50S ribosomal protein L15 [candidate division WOR-3 bacterium]